MLTEQFYDALNRMDQVDQSSVSDPTATLSTLDPQDITLQAHTDYGYDPLDQLTSVTDPNSNTTTYTINALGERTQLDSPDTGITSYPSYDEAGNLKQQTDAKNQTTTYSYDALNRLETITYHDGYTVDYYYDAFGSPVAHGLGRLIEIRDSNFINIRYEYDPLGRVTRETRSMPGQTAQIDYDYDSAGRLEQITYPSGRTVDYTFDSLGRIDAISTTDNGNTQTVADNITYQPFDGVNALSFSVNDSYSRSYDLDGRIEDYTLGGHLHTLVYDDASRIQSQSGDNILSPDLAALTETATIDLNSNRVQNIGATSITHDANGSITNDGIYSYTYDARGRLVHMTGTPGTVTYQVNALGQRVMKTSIAGITVYHYDTQGLLIAESLLNGTVIREYVYLGTMPVAVIENDTVYFIHTDHLDTPRVVTDDTGTIIWRWASDPFGEAWAESDPDDNGQSFEFNLRFPGQYFDTETGLHYNYYRDYAPGMGRYVQSDPIGLDGGVNTYGYVGGNPLTHSDFFGLEVTCKWITTKYYYKHVPIIDEPEKGHWEELCWPKPSTGFGGGPPTKPAPKPKPGPGPSPFDFIIIEMECTRWWVVDEEATYIYREELWMKGYMQCIDCCTGEKTNHWAPDRKADDNPQI